MKLNLEHQLCDMENKPLKVGEDYLTLERVLVQACLMTDEKENPSMDVKYKRYKLCKKLSGAKEIDLSSEEVVMLKDLVGRAFTTIVAGQAFDLLEGKSL